MNDADLNKLWQKKYQSAAKQIEKTADIKSVATGFNTNIDAVVKISGKTISEFAREFNITSEQIENCPKVSNSPQDVICGLCKCFIGGIAEEALCADIKLDEWTEKNLKTEHLQMGGQAGIIANVLALTRVQKILANTASHPKVLSEQFIKSDNLLAADEDGILAPAYKINRHADIPPIHRIIEFDRGDELILADGKKYTCPKSNRFIATYDPFNAEMMINPTFANCLQDGFDYFIFAGYNLLQGEHGLNNAEKSAELLQKLKQKNPNGIMHLEIASTPDKNILSYTLGKIARLADSIGLNERETLDVCEVIFPEIYNSINGRHLNAVNLLEPLLAIKKFTGVKRVQLHIFGLFVCLNDKDYQFTPEQTLNGMLFASAAATAKAELGDLRTPKDLTFALKNPNMKIYFSELQSLAEHLAAPELLRDGITCYQGFDLIAAPTMPVEKPKTLVGMGDTISSLSLICAR